jgi:hypothetical protein
MSKQVNQIWMTRKPGTYPNYEIGFDSDGCVKLLVFPSSTTGYSMKIKRQDAKLLAKRLNQALDYFQKH